MNVSLTRSAIAGSAHVAVEPGFVITAAIVAKSITIGVMFALSGVLTGWLLGAFPGLR